MTHKNAVTNCPVCGKPIYELLVFPKPKGDLSSEGHFSGMAVHKAAGHKAPFPYTVVESACILAENQVALLR